MSSAAISKFLSYVLRHKPEDIGLVLDSEGWAEIEKLLVCSNQAGQPLDSMTLRNIVRESDKKRFTISDDGLKIRAAQGHSTKTVTITHTEKAPPSTLFHGTATRFLESILKAGLVPGDRHFVHLSHDNKTAASVGMRHGDIVILRIAASEMHAQGHIFYQADNDVWLIRHVPAEFLCPIPPPTI
ncbi:RNA 2'-phosphotransferase [Polaromonas sp. P5_D5]